MLFGVVTVICYGLLFCPSLCHFQKSKAWHDTFLLHRLHPFLPSKSLKYRNNSSYRGLDFVLVIPSWLPPCSLKGAASATTSTTCRYFYFLSVPSLLLLHSKNMGSFGALFQFGVILYYMPLRPTGLQSICLANTTKAHFTCKSFSKVSVKLKCKISSSSMYSSQWFWTLVLVFSTDGFIFYQVFQLVFWMVPGCLES